ncbi:hypothetical protein LCGC14_2422220, partial [marine sediment metagenome]
YIPQRHLYSTKKVYQITEIKLITTKGCLNKSGNQD